MATTTIRGGTCTAGETAVNPKRKKSDLEGKRLKRKKRPKK